MANKQKNNKNNSFSFFSEIRKKKDSWNFAGHSIPEELDDTYAIQNTPNAGISQEQVDEILTRINNKYNVNSDSAIISEKDKYMAKIQTIFSELIIDNDEGNVLTSIRNLLLFALVLIIPAKGIINYVHKIAISKA